MAKSYHLVVDYEFIHSDVVKETTSRCLPLPTYFDISSLIFAMENGAGSGWNVVNARIIQDYESPSKEELIRKMSEQVEKKDIKRGLNNA